MEEDVGGAYFDDAFEEQRSYARKDVSVSQANKGIRRMPRRSATKKDAVSCEKTWGAASRQRTMYLRMGQPAIRRDSIVKEEKPGELKHLSNRRKRNQQRSTHEWVGESCAGWDLSREAEERVIAVAMASDDNEAGESPDKQIGQQIHEWSA